MKKLFSRIGRILLLRHLIFHFPCAGPKSQKNENQAAGNKNNRKDKIDIIKKQKSNRSNDQQDQRNQKQPFFSFAEKIHEQKTNGNRVDKQWPQFDHLHPVAGQGAHKKGDAGNDQN